MEYIPSTQELYREGNKRWKYLKKAWVDGDFRASKSLMVSASYLVRAYKSGSLDGDDVCEYLGISPDNKVYVDSGGFSNELPTNFFEDLVEIQEKINAEVFFTLDTPLKKCTTKHFQKNFDLAKKNLEVLSNPKAKIYGVIHASSREEAKKITEKYESLNQKTKVFDGYGIGSLVNDRVNTGKLIDIIKGVRESTSKPIHCFGISGFRLLYFYPLLNINSFDSYTYLAAAKFREYLIPQTEKRALVSKKRKDKKRKLDGLPCDCPCCRYAKERGGAKFYSEDGSRSNALLAIHNLFVLKNEVELINTAWKMGWYYELLKDKGLLPLVEKLNLSVK